LSKTRFVSPKNEYEGIWPDTVAHVKMAIRLLTVLRNVALLAAATSAIPALLILAVLFPFLDLCLPEKDVEEDDDDGDSETTISIDEHVEEEDDDYESEEEDISDDEKEEGEISEDEYDDEELSDIEKEEETDTEIEERDSWIPTGKINILMNASGQTGRTFTMEFDFDTRTGVVLDAINTSAEAYGDQPDSNVSDASASSAVEAPASGSS